HTRSYGDWSSDVCSSDLGPAFIVVGVGASAGGLEAFTDLLQGLPPDPGLALLFVNHLEPHRKSQLVQILTQVTPLRVLQAAEGIDRKSVVRERVESEGAG